MFSTFYFSRAWPRYSLLFDRQAYRKYNTITGRSALMTVLQNCLEMERFLDREPLTSVIDDAQCLSPAAAARHHARSLQILGPERIRIWRHSSCSEDEICDTNSACIARVSAGFDSDSGCGTSEPSSPDTLQPSVTTTSPVRQPLSDDHTEAEIVVISTCRCVETHPAKARRCRSSSCESVTVADRPNGDGVTDGAMTSENRCDLLSSRAHCCSFQGCRKMYTKRSHLKSHLRTHTGWRRPLLLSRFIVNLKFSPMMGYRHLVQSKM